MTNIERFQKEQVYNQDHPIFAPFDDDELGERVPGLFRKEIEDNGHECLNVIFDNGEHFVYDRDEEMLYYVNKIPEIFFIHKFLEKVLYDFIEEHELNRDIYCSKEEVEVRSLIRLVISREEGIVYLPNIMLPQQLRHQGLGLKLISALYAVCKRTGYRLVLSMMVDSFYKRMVERGATVLDFEKLF